jgi:hypothetical protein
MRGATATTINAKATAFRIVRSPSVTLGSLEGPSRAGQDQDDMWVRTLQSLPGTIETIHGDYSYSHPTNRLLRERPSDYDGTFVGCPRCEAAGCWNAESLLADARPRALAPFRSNYGVAEACPEPRE